MKFSLVFVLLCAFYAAAIAAPGMRGNGASGATRDQDPDNPNIRNMSSGPGYQPRGSAAAIATGPNSSSSTYSENKGGKRYSIAQASSHGGIASAAASASG